MVQSLELGTTNRSADDKGMKRLNRMPLFFGIGILVLFLAVLVYGLSSRGLRFGQPNSNENGSSTPASTFADQLKRGVKDGIIGDLEETPQVFQPTPVSQRQDTVQTLEVESKVQPREDRRPRTETDEEWNARMLREQREQIFREQQRQRMASLQARATALDSPLKVDISEVQEVKTDGRTSGRISDATGANSATDLYSAAMKSGLTGQNIDPNSQTAK